MIKEFFALKPDRNKIMDAIIRCLVPDMEQRTMVDMCCERAAYSRLLPFKEKTFVDCREFPGVDYPGEFINESVMEFKIPIQPFDFLFCNDGIEHLKDEEAKIFILGSHVIANIRLFESPLGKIWCVPGDKDPGNHRSGWTPLRIEKSVGPGEYDYLVFYDWYGVAFNYPIPFAGFLFWNSQGWRVFKQIVDEIKKITGETDED